MRSAADGGGIRQTLSHKLRDPFVQFLLLGGALFALDRAVHGEPESRGEASAALATELSQALPAEPIVTLSAEQREQLRAGVAAAVGREPTPQELQEALDRWSEEQILYREGLARGFGTDDPRIVSLIAEQMTAVLLDALPTAAPSEDELTRWFASHQKRWERPALVDFVQVFVAFGAADGGAEAEAEARATQLLAELEAGAAPEGRGDLYSGGRRYRRRSAFALEEAFGAEFASGVEQQPEGRWAMHRSRQGYHLVRVERRSPSSAPAFEQVRAEVAEDLQRSRQHEAYRAELQKLRARWQVVEAP